MATDSHSLAGTTCDRCGLARGPSPILTLVDADGQARVQASNHCGCQFCACGTCDRIRAACAFCGDQGRVLVTDADGRSRVVPCRRCSPAKEAV